MKSIVYLCLVVLVALSSCVEEEKFETAAGDRLTFSVDTLRMDTVIAGTNSVTRRFAIYNNNSDGVSITNIAFLNGITSGFSVIVDGSYVDGNLATSIDCRSKDSLLAYVQITPPESNQDDKVLHEATLVFTLANGAQQSVVLSAYSQDVIWMRDAHVQTDMQLSAQRPYVIKDSLTIEEGCTLTLEAGVRLMFASNAHMRVEGRLIANGTREKPVVLRGDRMDYMFENQPYDRISEQWQGVFITDKSYGNSLNYCDIHSGAYGILCESVSSESEKLRLENCVIHNVSGTALESYNAKIFAGNTQVSNAGGYCVCLYGGDNEFVHCTIAQFYPFSGMRGPALYYTNYKDKTNYHLTNAAFYNCIITGYSDDEIFGDRMEGYGAGAFNYYFQNCLLNTVEVVDEDLINNVWDKKSNKVSRAGNFPHFNLDALSYDFHLDSLSVAVGAGDPSVTQSYYPLDRDGKRRLVDGKSDAGCYEY
ncbi:MAG: hypothetical protein II122_00315 [Bacteroidaceae bacterium]|nr:hypothetical protein [Bacteroidaceae bacterium]